MYSAYFSLNVACRFYHKSIVLLLFAYVYMQGNELIQHELKYNTFDLKMNSEYTRFSKAWPTLYKCTVKCNIEAIGLAKSTFRKGCLKSSF